MTAATDVTATRGKRRGKVDINMDISGTICHRALIILFLESPELGEDNADEQVSDIRRIIRASESEKQLSIQALCRPHPANWIQHIHS